MSRPKNKRRGVLNVVASLLVISAVLRTTIGANEAFANSPETPVPLPIDTAIVTSPSEDILAALQARENRIAEREAIFADRMQALNVAEKEISEKMIALKGAEEALSATIARADTASETDLSRLTIVYENMAPKDAAALFEHMPPAFAAGFLGLMEPIAAAKVMAGLKPETAYSFSVVLAGRNALVPTQ